MDVILRLACALSHTAKQRFGVSFSWLSVHTEARISSELNISSSVTQVTDLRRCCKSRVFTLAFTFGSWPFRDGLGQPAKCEQNLRMILRAPCIRLRPPIPRLISMPIAPLRTSSSCVTAQKRMATLPFLSSLNRQTADALAKNCSSALTDSTRQKNICRSFLDKAGSLRWQTSSKSFSNSFAGGALKPYNLQFALLIVLVLKSTGRAFVSLAAVMF